MEKEKTIYVFADFAPFLNELIGTIYVSQTRGKELYAFEYDQNWLEHGSVVLDPDLYLYKGRQYIADNKNIWGMFADSCPDRWGRQLMKRREELRAKKENEKPRKLLESDYLLGVFDEARMGALRFKTDLSGGFLSNDKEFATPPWTSLRELEQASAVLEEDDNKLCEKWLKQLMAPGSSLGGARPKATVMAPDGSLWIAKFPSKHDDFDTGAWEMTVHELAVMCGMNVPEAKSQKFSKLGTTFLVKRFDRNGNKRIHFSSAMTMLGKTDGANATDGSSYLELVSFLKANGANPMEDIEELWKRLVFSMAVSNTDDHFRNHGFILSNHGWRLSPLYDVNPDLYGEYLSLNVNETESSIDINLAIDSAKYYGLEKDKAVNIAKGIETVVRDNWRELAKKNGISLSDKQSPRR